MADLIDRAALLEKIDKNFFATCPEGDEQLGYINSRNLIRTAPAVDAVEVKHGHWQEYEDYCLDVYYDCSVCGGMFYMADGTPTENGYNFCPKCGARMGETIRVELENDEID